MINTPLLPASVHGNARLTEAEVRAIRRRAAEGGVTQAALATEYGVHEVTISQIINRKTWVWLDDGNGRL
jgi:DNA invertase Pin-like site-specific DNA recombinase